MNKSTLNALINLFAVFSIKGEKDYETAKINLGEYLSNQLGIKDPTEYLAQFYGIFDLYKSGIRPITGENIKVIVGNICNQVKSRIHHSEQLMIFLHFLELARRDYNCTEYELYDLVAEIFEIKPDDYLAFKQFIFFDRPEKINSAGFLIVNKHHKSHSNKVLHIRKVNITGDILIYHIAEINQFIFKYFGNDQLTLEGNRIHPDQFYFFNPGGIVRDNINTNLYYTEVYSAFFHFQSKDEMVFTGREISYSFPNSNNGIHEFSFSEYSGQIIAVLGGSGVGKSTLLNVLNGILPLKTGSITINGIDIHKEYNKIEGLIGYIPQDDLVFEDLTVYQNVYYNALLCLNHIPIEEIRIQIDKLLTDLNLYDIRDMVVGNPLKKVLSGGQRKRLNIALELIREPSILFVDEPTSGLSSRDSEKIIVLLKQQAQQGNLVIVNIHQPSSFIYKQFDKIWILDEGGYPVYAGNPLDAILYFKKLDKHIDAENFECRICGNVNPDQVLEIIETQKFDESGRLTPERKFSPQELNILFNENIQKKVEFITPKNNSVPVINFKKPSRLKQFKIFFSRNLHAKNSNRQYIYINLFQTPVLALIVSFLTRYSSEEGYYFGLNKNFPSFIFMAVIVMLFQGMTLSAQEIIRDRKILQREAFLRLSRSSYLNSKIVFLFSVSFIQSFLFLAISSKVLGMQGLFLQYWLILFLTASLANLTGLNISSGLNSIVTIYITIPLLIIPQILLCGLIVKFDDIKGHNSKSNAVPLIGGLMAARWSFEALAVEQYTKNKYNIHYYEIEKEMSGYFIKGELIIPKLSNLIGSISFANAVYNNKSQDLKTLKTIENVMRQLDDDLLVPAFRYDIDLKNRSFSRTIADSAIVHLNQLRAIFKRQYQAAESRKDSITSNLVKVMGQDGLIRLKKLYQNSSLAELVSNLNPDNSIVQAGGKFLVKAVPIFRLPENRTGRAHFYAPYKIVGNMVIPTYYYNVLIIILMMIILYVGLYFDWLKRSVNYFGNFRLRFR